MPDYTFGGGDTIALNPATGLIEPNGVLTPYALSDPGHTTPLTVRSPSGIPMTTISTGPLGHVEEFVHDEPRLRLVSGGVEVVVTSIDGLLADALAAREAAESAVEQVRGLIESGGGGGGGGVSRHGALSQLDADDHPQYLTAARGDQRYPSGAAVAEAITTAKAQVLEEAIVRGNHRGLQSMSSIEGLQAALDAKAAALVVSSVEEVPAGTPVNTLIVVPTVASYGPAPTVLGSSSSSSAAAGATLVVTIPTTGTPGAGDMVIVALTTMSSVISQAWTPPDSTWTLLSPALVDLGGGQNQNTRITAIYGKRLTGAPAASYTFTSPGSDSQRRIATAVVVRDVDQTTPVASASSLVGINGTGTTDIALPALGAARPRTLQLTWAWSNGSQTDDFATLPVPSPSMTQVVAETLPATGTASRTQLVAWRRENATSGPVPSIALDFTARSQRGGFSLVLNPEVA